MIGMYMSVKNEERLVGRAIRSAIVSGVDEILVVDDWSTDGTVLAASKAADGFRNFRVVRSKDRLNRGVCFQQALFREVAEMKSEWLVGMGADDLLIPAGANAFRRCVPDLVNFCDYCEVGEDGSLFGWWSCGYHDVKRLGPDAVRGRIVSMAAKHECGIGSFVHRDILDELYNDLEAWRMGPWSDSIGLTAMALRHGATYIPAAAASFCVRRADGRLSYSQEAIGRQDRRDECLKEAREFLGAFGFDEPLKEALIARWS